MSVTSMLKLKILTPAGTAAEAEGNSVHLPLADDSSGRGAGDLGIRPGHLPAVIALGTGAAFVLLNGEERLRVRLNGGFASVKNDEVTVIADSVVI